MSPLPRTGRTPQPDPVYGATVAPFPAEDLADSIPIDQVDPTFAENMEQVDAVGGPASYQDDAGPDAESGPEVDALDMRVTDHLEAAVAAAEAGGMSPSELIGLFFYYAHSIAAEGREAALRQSGAPSEMGSAASRTESAQTA